MVPILQYLCGTVSQGGHSVNNVLGAVRPMGANQADHSHTTAGTEVSPFRHSSASPAVEGESTSPAVASATEGEGNDDLLIGYEPMYDPFHRPAGEVVVEVFPPSRSRSPRRSRSV